MSGRGGYGSRSGLFTGSVYSPAAGAVESSSQPR